MRTLFRFSFPLKSSPHNMSLIAFPLVSLQRRRLHRDRDEAFAVLKYPILQDKLCLFTRCNDSWSKLSRNPAWYKMLAVEDFGVIKNEGYGVHVEKSWEASGTRVYKETENAHWTHVCGGALNVPHQELYYTVVVFWGAEVFLLQWLESEMEFFFGTAGSVKWHYCVMSLLEKKNVRTIFFRAPKTG